LFTIIAILLFARQNRAENRLDNHGWIGIREETQRKLKLLNARVLLACFPDESTENGDFGGASYSLAKHTIEIAHDPV
jgi:hypothetical protein